MGNEVYRYFVEGECEKHFVNIYKRLPTGGLKPGKVEVFNVARDLLEPQRIMGIPRKAVVVFIFDVDCGGRDKVNQNIERVTRYSYPKSIVLVPSVENFEDELVRSTPGAKNIEAFFGVRSPREFKSRFLSCQNLAEKLESLGFDLSSMWTTTPHQKDYRDLEGGGTKIKERQKPRRTFKN